MKLFLIIVIHSLGVKVELLVSQWPHSPKSAIHFYNSLLQINAALPETGDGRQGSISIVSVFLHEPINLFLFDF